MTKETQLRNTLKANMIFSGFSGFMIIIFKTQLAQLMNIEAPITLVIIGLALLVFSCSIFVIVRAKTLNQIALKSIIVQDGLWVIGSLFIILFNPFDISHKGKLLILFISIIVGVFAFLQGKLIKSAN